MTVLLRNTERGLGEKYNHADLVATCLDQEERIQRLERTLAHAYSQINLLLVRTENLQRRIYRLEDAVYGYDYSERE